MSSNHYAAYGDDDLADLISYLQAVPPVDNDLGERQLQFPGNIIFGVLAFDSWSINQTDHEAVGGDAPPLGETAVYGKYLIDIASYTSCHAENLAGNYGQLDSPFGSNLTQLTERMTPEQLGAALRTGTLPDGRQIGSEMPINSYAEISGSEVQAIWEYLNSLEPLPNNSVE